jgi:hypothetical protein
MRTFLALLGSLFSYFCVATVIALVTAIVAMWFKGALDEERLYRVLASLHGVDMVTMQRELIQEMKAPDMEQPSAATRMDQQMLKSLDLDLRELAMAKGIESLGAIETQLQTETTRFEKLKKDYAVKLKEIEDEERATAMKELQRTMEAIRPAQAKEQILKMLDDNAMDDVVSILRNMAIDKRKKIIAEFKQGADAEKLYEILKNIRLGEPIVSQIEDARDELNQFGPTK